MKNTKQIVKKICILELILFASWIIANLTIHVFNLDTLYLIGTTLIFLLTFSTILVLLGTLLITNKPVFVSASKIIKPYLRDSTAIILGFLFLITGTSLSAVAVSAERAYTNKLDKAPSDAESKITLATDKTEYGEEDKITLTLRNNLGKTIKYIDWDTNCQGTAFTIGLRGNSDYNFKPLTINKCVYVKVVELPAGVEKTYTLDLSNWETPPQTSLNPGTYKLKFNYSYKNMDFNETASAYSNEFSIKKAQEVYKGISAIELEIAAPFSIATIAIDKQGNINYKAEEREGVSRQITETKEELKEISDDQFNELAELITNSNFFSLNENYIQEQLMDAVFYTITVTTGDQTKSVTCYGSCPQEFTELHEKIIELWGQEVLELGI